MTNIDHIIGDVGKGPLWHAAVRGKDVIQLFKVGHNDRVVDVGFIDLTECQFGNLVVFAVYNNGLLAQLARLLHLAENVLCVTHVRPKTRLTLPDSAS